MNFTSTGYQLHRQIVFVFKLCCWFFLSKDFSLLFPQSQILHWCTGDTNWWFSPVRAPEHQSTSCAGSEGSSHPGRLPALEKRWSHFLHLLDFSHYVFLHMTLFLGVSPVRAAGRTSCAGSEGSQVGLGVTTGTSSHDHHHSAYLSRYVTLVERLWKLQRSRGGCKDGRGMEGIVQEIKAFTEDTEESRNL